MLVALCAACAGTGVGQRAAPAKPSSPLQILNATARADYAQARERLLRRAGPILLASDKLYLIRDGKRDEAPLEPPGYHELKAVAHASIGLHALFLEGPADPARLEELRAAIQGVLAALPALPFSEEQRRRQRRILEASLLVTTPDQLLRYQREVAPLLLENARDAARAQVDLIHAAVARVRRAFRPGSVLPWSRAGFFPPARCRRLCSPCRPG